MLSKITFAIGLTLILLLFLISYVNMSDIKLFNNYITNWVLIIICPILGIIGAILAIKSKNMLWFILNVMIALSYFLVMSISYLIA